MLRWSRFQEKKLIEVLEEEGVFVEVGHAEKEIAKVVLPLLKRLVVHHHASQGDHPPEGLSDDDHVDRHDGEDRKELEGQILDDPFLGQRKPLLAENLPGPVEALPQEGTEVPDSHLLGGLIAGEQLMEVEGVALRLCPLLAPVEELMGVREADEESRNGREDEEKRRRPVESSQKDGHGDEGEGVLDDGHQAVDDSDGTNRRLLLSPVEGVEVGGVFVEA